MRQIHKIENYIEIDDEKYPVICDLAALKTIQEAYGSINRFERDIKGLKVKIDGGVPVRNKDGSLALYPGDIVIEAIITGLYAMTTEGIEAARSYGMDAPEPFQDIVEAGRAVINVNEAAVILRTEFDRCFVKKKRSRQTTNRKK